jgi:glucosylceramidase
MIMIRKARILGIIICFVGALFILQAQQINISGTVKDQASGTGIQGAVVSLAGSGRTCITDKTGFYSFGGAVLTLPVALPGENFQQPYISQNRLVLGVPDAIAHVRVELYTLSGRLLRVVLDKQLIRGNYRINPLLGTMASQLYVVRVQVGNNVTVLKMSPLGGPGKTGEIANMANDGGRPLSCAKAVAVVDSIFAWAVGYDVGRLNIENLTGVYDILLHRTIAAGQVQVIQTSQAGDKLAVKSALAFINDDGSVLSTLTVTPATTYQNIVGFGAAFTETAVYNLEKITTAKRSEVLNAFFNPYSGSGYTLCRITINSCDFSLGSYNYDDVANDYNLANFNISHDQKWMIPAVKEALAVPGASFKLFGSPWAPPGWMKTTGQMLGGNNGSLKPACYDAWALYFVKYIQTMKTNGIPIWGITVQNEPAYDAGWEACTYTPAQERDFLKNSLGPTLAKNNIDVKVMIWDHNKDAIVNWATTILGDAAAAKYAWGTAYHRYAGDLFDNLTATHNAFPGYPMVATECSVRETWAEAERMAHEILGDLNHWSGGYLTWNLTTDLAGGPYHNRGNGCVGPIVVDSASGAVNYFGNYYYMTHFSKYLRPDAVRIGCAYSGTDLELTAFKNTNGSIVVVVLNKTNNAVTFKIKQGTQIVKPTIPAHAIVDFIY